MIVGIAGKKGSGKSTAASILNEEGFETLAFAATLKRMVAILLTDLGLSADEVYAAVYGDDESKDKIIPLLGVSGRHIMQTLGTEWGRRLIHNDLWVMTAEHAVAIHPDGEGLDAVVEDVRFPNEVEFVKKRGGMIVGLMADTDTDTDSHESESGIGVDPDTHIVNDKTGREDLRKQLLTALHIL